MSERKTPILLRRGGLSGEVQALYRYTTTEHGALRASGKQSVQDDYEEMVLQQFLDAAPDLIAALDGAALGEPLNDDECKQIRHAHDQIKAMALRHNERAAPHPKRGAGG